MMKVKYLLLAAALFQAAAATAQQALNVVRGGVAYNFPANAELMPYAEGATVSIQGAVFRLDDIDRMEVVTSTLDENTVLVEYADTAARITIAGNLADYVSATVSGAHVAIVQSDAVSAGTCGEITYILRGEAADGSCTLSGAYKSTVELQGLALTNPHGAALDIDNGKRIALSVKSGTFNTLVDGADGTQKAALYCKGHLEIKGKGTLSVTGRAAHAIAAKEYVEMKNCTVNILAAAKDGIHCNQFFRLESGALTLGPTGDDGIQVSCKESVDREADDTGSIFIDGGTLSLANLTAIAAKGLKAEGDFVMTAGTIDITTAAPGTWDATDQKTKASACISADGNVAISDGVLRLAATSGGAKGISCDGRLTIAGGTLEIATSGGMLVYSNGTVNSNYTGNADNVKSNCKSSPKGIKADGDVEIQGGAVSISTTGNGGEGIESKSALRITAGDVKVRAKDDAINSSGHMYIDGGTVDVISTGNDGLDSNGNLYINGGVIMAFGAAAPECGLDANEEDGYTVCITGGYVLAGGGGNSVPTTSASTQPYVSVSTSVSGGTAVSIADGDTTLYTFTTPSDLASTSSGSGSRPGGGNSRPGGPGGTGSGGSSLLISVPGLTNGASYTVVSGASSTTGTARTTGTSFGPGGR